MQIKTKLTLLFTLITATLLLAFASIIYIAAKNNREKEFYDLLKKEAVTKANLFLNAEVKTKTLQDIYRNNREILNEVEVAIYDTDFNLLYHDAIDIDLVKETREMIDDVYEKNEIRFYQNDWQALGLRYEFQDKTYIIVATAYDEYGFNKLSNLLRNSVILFTLSILVIYWSGRYFSKRVFSPVREMTKRANEISATNLDLRLENNNNNNKDELAELANTFNEMLSRLEYSYEAQKQFVTNISHELRTPLAAIIAELELSLTKKRNANEYQSAIENAHNDAKKLVRLSNSLLDLAKASYDKSEISFKQVRIDEIIIDARQQLQKVNPTYKVGLNFENEFKTEEQVCCNGNEYLLKTAFINLMENACKFSKNQECSVLVSFENEYILLKFSDDGIGISEENLEHIFKPFYRGENKEFIEGSGVGLTLTKKIIDLHNGSISVKSIKKQGTSFKLQLPNLS